MAMYERSSSAHRQASESRSRCVRLAASGLVAIRIVIEDVARVCAWRRSDN
jgi:hypothetical protein